MRKIIFLLQKEFIQIFRNKMMIPIIFVMPVVQLLILSYTATFEIKNASVAFIDLDQSSHSRELMSKFSGSPFFTVKGNNFSMKTLENEMLRNNVEMIIEIPAGFEQDLLLGKPTTVQIVPDAVNGSAANLMAAYAAQIVMDFNSEIITKNSSGQVLSAGVKLSPSYWFNPDLNYKTYMVPGILVLLVTMIGAFLSGMNLVREKEIGTIEQLNVTPIKKYELIIGKLLPFWIIAMFDLVFGMVVAVAVFDIPILGSPILILSAAAIYLLLVLGLGLFISTITDTQQQAMFLAWFFMVIFIMMSGLFTPVESMPDWAQMINVINPVAYFIEFMRLVMLKGSGLYDVLPQISKIGIYAIIMMSLSIWRYRKVA